MTGSGKDLFGDPNQDPIEDALRASLADHAARAPEAGPVSDRIVRVATAGAATGRPAARGGWRSWTLPVVAAASVAAVVVAVAGIESVHPHHDPSLGSAHVSPSVPTHPATPRTSAAPTVRPAPTGTPSTIASVPVSTPVSSPVLHGVHVLDLTFAGADDGWALASADCLVGPGRCTAVLRTTDGASWHGIPGARFPVPGVRGCVSSCVEHLRFATDRIGYAYGPDVLYMTTDGGASWHRQPGGGADGLETADGDAIRLVSDHSGCSGLCDVRVELAHIGATDWTTVDLAGAPVSGDRARLVRAGPQATVLVSTGGSAGSAPKFRLFVSADDGRHWADRADPCAAGAGAPGAPVASVGTQDVAMGIDGSLALLCAGANGRPEWVAASANGTAFSRRPAMSFAPSGSFLTIGALLPSTVFAADSSTLRRSVDGGRTWQAVAEIPSFVIFLGFENDHVGRLLIDGGRGIWTTRDAGRTWSEVLFS